MQLNPINILFGLTLKIYNFKQTNVPLRLTIND